MERLLQQNILLQNLFHVDVALLMISYLSTVLWSQVKVLN